MLVFNTSNTSGGHVTNVAGNFATYIQIASNVSELAYAKGASWNPTLVCLSGTRVQLLYEIDMWSHAQDSQNVLWLKGVAGSGKSAIAHTIAQMLQEDGRLGSSFFFNRNVASLNNSQLIFTTIARDLASRDAAIAADISNTLGNEPALASAHLLRQFEALIAAPLRRHGKQGPFIVVIDALDEGVSEDDGNSLLDILCNNVAALAPNFRILITSRPTSTIMRSLSGKKHITSRHIDIHSVDNQRDVAAYVDSRMRADVMRTKMGAPWPEEAMIHALKILAEGLFIWIVTVCNYLRSTYMPREKLRMLLSKAENQGLPTNTKMDNLYAGILEASGDWEDPAFLHDYQIVVGALMAAKRPLSLTALKALHGGNFPVHVSPEVLLEMFGAVFVGFDSPGEPIRMMHLSFREFITRRAIGAEHSRKFHISEKEHSGRLAELCLQTMVRELSAAPIPGTGYLAEGGGVSLGIPRVTGVSEQLLYACDSMPEHIGDIEDPAATMVAEMQNFLPRHNQSWIEIISSISVFRGSLAVPRWLEVSSSFAKIHQSTDDPKTRTPALRGLYDDKVQASMLLRLSDRLGSVGRLEEALTAIRESADLRRPLAEKQPTLFNVDLVTSLDGLFFYLDHLGHREEALTASQESVNVHQALAAERGLGCHSELSLSLNRYAETLASLGHYEEALTAIRTSVDVLRDLAAEQPAAFNDALARVLRNMSGYLANLDQIQEALTAVQEAVIISRALVAEQPSVLSGELALALTSLAVILARLGRVEEAFIAVQESVDLLRHRAELSAMFNEHLALSLSNMSGYLLDLRRGEEALAAIRESVDLCRALADKRPTRFNTELALSLYLLAGTLSQLGRNQEALTAIQESLDMRRDLAAMRPSRSNSEIVLSLTRLAETLASLNRYEEALVAIQESVDLLRGLVADQPAAFNSDLSRCLRIKSGYLDRFWRSGEALSAAEEAVGIGRALVAAHPLKFNGELAFSLSDLAVTLAGLGRGEQALASIEESVELLRDLVKERPAIFSEYLALSLGNMSIYLSNLGRQEKALTAIQESLSMRRVLAAEEPTRFNAELVWSLDALARKLSDLGRREEALAVFQELVDLYEGFVAN
ncbi:hypothetical protein HWV62_40888 [Athelia sp. TMB]|nr:hypothetical protein HWV62_40888 [Athelia sp. TMB]